MAKSSGKFIILVAVVLIVDPPAAIGILLGGPLARAIKDNLQRTILGGVCLLLGAMLTLFEIMRAIAVDQSGRAFEPENVDYFLIIAGTFLVGLSLRTMLANTTPVEPAPK